jgi:hypothetical protein
MIEHASDQQSRASRSADDEDEPTLIHCPTRLQGVESNCDRSEDTDERRRRQRFDSRSRAMYFMLQRT